MTPRGNENRPLHTVHKQNAKQPLPRPQQGEHNASTTGENVVKILVKFRVLNGFLEIFTGNL